MWIYIFTYICLCVIFRKRKIMILNWWRQRQGDRDEKYFWVWKKSTEDRLILLMLSFVLHKLFYLTHWQWHVPLVTHTRISSDTWLQTEQSLLPKFHITLHFGTVQQSRALLMKLPDGEKHKLQYWRPHVNVVILVYILFAFAFCCWM